MTLMLIILFIACHIHSTISIFLTVFIDVILIRTVIVVATDVVVKYVYLMCQQFSQ